MTTPPHPLLPTQPAAPAAPAAKPLASDAAAVAAKPLHVLVLGLGSIGQRHARLLATRADVKLSLCDPVARARQQAQAEWANALDVFPDASDALASGPQAVIVAAPNAQHVPLGVAALRAGAHVLMEKPLSDDPAAAEQLVSEARQANRVLHVGYVLRYDAGLRLVKEAIDQGRLGRVVAARAMVGSYQTLLSSRGVERLQEPFSLIGDYSHELDYLRWLLGPVASVCASADTLGSMDLRPQPNVAQISLTFASGALAQVHMDYVQHPARRTIDIIGDQGTLDYDFMTGRLRLFHFGSQHKWDETTLEPMAQRFDQLFVAEHEAFLAACRGNDAKADIDGEDGLAALHVAQAVIASTQRKASVDLPVGSSRQTWPGWTARHEQFKSLALEQSPQWLFLGDSLTAGWQLAPQAWNTLIDSRRAVAMGMDGDTSDNLLWRIADMATIGLSPRLTVVLVGCNDLARRTGRSPAAACAGVARVLNRLRVQWPRAKHVLLGLFPCIDPVDILPLGNEGLRQTTLLLRDIARPYGATFIDIADSLLKAHDATGQVFASDGVHLTAAGYEIVAQLLRPRLLAIDT